MNDLSSLLQAAPANSTAVIIPETATEVTYGSLYRQVMTMAETLAGMGVRRGDRVGNVLANGLPTIVAFLAGSIAGTAAPLNPAYRFDEFCFYLEDTSAKVLLVPPEGADDARRAAKRLNIPLYVVNMDEKGNVSIMDAPGRSPVTPPSPDDVALVLHTSGSTGRPKRVPLKHRNRGLMRQRRPDLSAHRERRFLVRDAAVPHSWSGCIPAFNLPYRGHRGGAEQIQSHEFLADDPGAWRDLVFLRADHPSTFPGAAEGEA